MATPLAYLITIRTYGTWLHGDERGSVDRHHNQYGAPTLPRDPQRSSMSAQLMKAKALIFAPSQRALAANAIRRECEFRGWNLLAVNVLSNHAHAVLGGTEEDSRTIVKNLKSRATANLRCAGETLQTQPVWAGGGSRKFLWTVRQVNAAIAYVNQGQDRAC